MSRIPMIDLKRQYHYMKDEVDEAIGRCLDHQCWILGPEVGELEDNLSRYLGVDHCIAVSSGSEALVLCLRAMAILNKGEEFWDRDDLVITAPFTFTATGDAILRAGATPLFVDIDYETGNLDPRQVSSALDDPGYASRIVGLLPVHLYGQSCSMDEITAVAGEKGLFVLEDAAQAFGGRWGERGVGSLGSAGAFSFFPSKNMGCFGDGGLVSTGDPSLAELVRMLLRHGGMDKYNVDHVGYNARLDTIQAAVLLVRLKYVDEFNGLRRKVAAVYDEALKGVEGISVPTSLPKAFHVYNQYTIRVHQGKRNSLQEYLHEAGVATMIYYKVPLHQMPVFQGRSESFGELGITLDVVEEVLSLPMDPLQTGESTLEVAELVGEGLRTIG